MAQTSIEKYRKIAERYTNALLKIAQENGSIQQIADDLKQVVGAFSTNPDIENFFTSPIISKEDKKDILEKSFKGKMFIIWEWELISPSVKSVILSVSTIILE